VTDLKHFRSDWNDGELTGWSCDMCGWKQPLAPYTLNISSIGVALTAYLAHSCTCHPAQIVDFTKEIAA
jgi:hypothetical protein